MPRGRYPHLSQAFGDLGLCIRNTRFYVISIPKAQDLGPKTLSNMDEKVRAFIPSNRSAWRLAALFVIWSLASGCTSPAWADGEGPARGETAVAQQPPVEHQRLASRLGWWTGTPATNSVEVEVASLVTQLNFPGLVEKNSPAVWITLAALLAMGFLCGRTCAALLQRVGRRFHDRDWEASARLLLDLAGPAQLALFALAVTLGLAGVEMSDPLRVLAGKSIKLMYCLAVYWYVFNLIGMVDLAMRRLQSQRASQLDKQLAPWIRKILRSLLVTMAILFIVESVFEQDVRAWLAGLGIAGLALSLAAQDSIKNLFGSVTILVDRPFQVGERIIFGGYDGAIEEIGFRSTAVRTMNGHLVTIPNSKIVSDSVENISRRPYIRRAFSLNLPPNTPVEKLTRAVALVRETLAASDLAAPLQTYFGGEALLPRAHLAELTDDKAPIAVAYWYSPPKYAEYLAHAEQVNVRILTRFAAEGLTLSAPAPTPAAERKTT